MAESGKTVESVYASANQLAGLTVTQVASQVGIAQPENLVQEKGWVGQLIEAALDAESGSLAQPDFPSIGLELKTIPIDSAGKALESTYVSVVPLMDVRGATWHESVVWQKLSRVLWVPLLAEKQIPLAQRVFATPVLWSPSAADEKLLRADWEAVMEKVSLGQIDTLKLTTWQCTAGEAESC